MAKRPVSAFGKNLLSLMLAKGRNQTSLATALGVGKSTVNGWIHGRMSPRMANLLAIAEVLQVPVDALRPQAQTRPQAGARPTNVDLPGHSPEARSGDTHRQEAREMEQDRFTDAQWRMIYKTKRLGARSQEHIADEVERLVNALRSGPKARGRLRRKGGSG